MDESARHWGAMHFFFVGPCGSAAPQRGIEIDRAGQAPDDDEINALAGHLGHLIGEG
jgi:hypothetical protein